MKGGRYAPLSNFIMSEKDIGKANIIKLQKKEPKKNSSLYSVKTKKAKSKTLKFLQTPPPLFFLPL
ncbi:protein of unknown function (plasmid) [endosymbiont DhMRE of Dentiscutata heterogama]|nr:protein of unknown function [endosymbiont DhMRE of Dentiscutata heterogama]